MAAASQLGQTLSAFLASRSLQPTQAWMDNFMSSARTTTPLAALQKTVLFRLLASDFTTSLQSSPSSVLPAGATAVEVKEQVLRGTIPVQLLDIEDVGRSRWSQVELLEQHERGEMTKGREIIRLAPESESDGNPVANQHLQQNVKSSGPHKLLLQDVNGVRIYAIELVSVEGIGTQMAIGTKMLLRDAIMARGVMLLEPRCVEILGGKVELWDKEWRATRKDVLAQKARSSSDG